jgi:hypothetical protein
LGATRKIYRPTGITDCQESSGLYFYKNETISCDVAFTPSATCTGISTLLDPANIAPSLSLYGKKSDTTAINLSTGANIVWLKNTASTNDLTSTTTVPVFSATTNGASCNLSNSVTGVEYIIESNLADITGIKAVVQIADLV